MQFFLDTADVSIIRQLAATGFVDGITTNPSLVMQSGLPFEEALKDICKLINGPVSAEVVAMDKDGMIKEGRHLAKIADNIVIKVPLTMDGLMACQAFRAEGIDVNVTLCFSASQALLAAKAGATFISPFIGRLDDIGHNGMELIREISEIYTMYAFDTQILAASIRHPLHVIETAKMGCDAATIPPKIFEQLINHPLTDKGLDGFAKDWARTGQKIG